MGASCRQKVPNYSRYPPHNKKSPELTELYEEELESYLLSHNKGTEAATEEVPKTKTQTQKEEAAVAAPLSKPEPKQSDESEQPQSQTTKGEKETKEGEEGIATSRVASAVPVDDAAEGQSNNARIEMDTRKWPPLAPFQAKFGREHSVSYTTMRRWTKDFKMKKQVKIVTVARRSEPHNKIGREVENRYLSKLSRYTDIYPGSNVAYLLNFSSLTSFQTDFSKKNNVSLTTIRRWTKEWRAKKNVDLIKVQRVLGFGNL